MVKCAVRKITEKVFRRKIFFDSGVSDRYLVSMFLSYMVSAARGLFVFYSVVFVGRCVQFRAKSKISLGRGVRIGDYVLIDALGKEGVHLGDRVSIGPYTRICVSGSLASLGRGVWIGDDSAIGDFSHIGGAGGVVIGRNTIAGSYMSIHPENHNYSDTNTLIRLQGVNRQGVQIGDNCWLGAKVTILDGAKIGNGCVVAAGAVVRGRFPDDVIIGGVPAKILKKRCDV